MCTGSIWGPECFSSLHSTGQSPLAGANTEQTLD